MMIVPVHIFLSGSGEKGTSHLVKVIYNSISKTLSLIIALSL